MMPPKTWEPLTTEMVWMPVGLHRISPSTGEARHALVDQRAGENMLSAFEYIEERPWLDFDHVRKQSAGELVGLRWDERLGIVAAVRWSYRAEAEIKGGGYRFFSPTFRWNRETLRPDGFIGTDAGGLVNSPAFKTMPRIELLQLKGGRP